MDLRTALLSGGAVLAALALYIWQGHPGVPDQPFSERAAEIAARDVSELSADEMLTRLQMLAQEQPDLADPHYHIGVLLRSQGRSEDSLRAFQSAVRRDDRHVLSLIALADTLVWRDQGEISPYAMELFGRAWQLDPQQFRAGFLAGLALYRGGDEDTAHQQWDAVGAQLGDDDPRRDTLQGWVERVTLEAAELEAQMPQ